MKTNLLHSICFSCAALLTTFGAQHTIGAFEFDTSQPEQTEASLPPLQAWQPIAMTGSSTTREYVETVVDEKTGIGVPKFHRITEICSGLNYLDWGGGKRRSRSLN